MSSGNSTYCMESCSCDCHPNANNEYEKKARASNEPNLRLYFHYGQKQDDEVEKRFQTISAGRLENTISSTGNNWRNQPRLSKSLIKKKSNEEMNQGDDLLPQDRIEDNRNSYTPYRPRSRYYVNERAKEDKERLKTEANELRWENESLMIELEKMAIEKGTAVAMSGSLQRVLDDYSRKTKLQCGDESFKNILLGETNELKRINSCYNIALNHTFEFLRHVSRNEGIDMEDPLFYIENGDKYNIYLQMIYQSLYGHKAKEESQKKEILSQESKIDYHEGQIEEKIAQKGEDENNNDNNDNDMKEMNKEETEKPNLQQQKDVMIKKDCLKPNSTDQHNLKGKKEKGNQQQKEEVPTKKDNKKLNENKGNSKEEKAKPSGEKVKKNEEEEELITPKNKKTTEGVAVLKSNPKKEKEYEPQESKEVELKELKESEPKTPQKNESKDSEEKKTPQKSEPKTPKESEEKKTPQKSEPKIPKELEEKKTPQKSELKSSKKIEEKKTPQKSELKTQKESETKNPHKAETKAPLNKSETKLPQKSDRKIKQESQSKPNKNIKEAIKEVKNKNKPKNLLKQSNEGIGSVKNIKPISNKIIVISKSKVKTTSNPKPNNPTEKSKKESETITKEILVERKEDILYRKKKPIFQSQNSKSQKKINLDPIENQNDTNANNRGTIEHYGSYSKKKKQWSNKKCLTMNNSNDDMSKTKTSLLDQTNNNDKRNDSIIQPSILAKSSTSNDNSQISPIKVLHHKSQSMPDMQIEDPSKGINLKNVNKLNEAIRQKLKRAQTNLMKKRSVSPIKLETCIACNYDCHVSSTGYSPMTYTPYGERIRRRSFTPTKEKEKETIS